MGKREKKILGSEYPINKKLRKRVLSEKRKTKKLVYNTWLAEKILLYLGLVIAILYLVYRLILNTWLGIVGWDIISIDPHIFMTMFVLPPVWFGFCVYMCRRRFEAIYLKMKSNECIEISEDKLCYIGLMPYELKAGYVNVVIVDLNHIKNISYNEKTYEIEITGRILDKDVTGNVDLDRLRLPDTDDNTTIIPNYFEPSVYEVIKARLDKQNLLGVQKIVGEVDE